MKKVFNFVTKNYYRLGSMMLSIVAITFWNDNFRFWMLVAAAAVLSGLQDIIDEIKN